MTSLKILQEKFPNYEKTHSMKVRFFKHWNSLNEETRKKCFPKEEDLTRAINDIKSLGPLADDKQLAKATDDFLKAHNTSLEHVLEFVKIRT